MLPPRSIPAFAPPLDRLTVRAALASKAAWPRTGAGLASLVATHAGLEPERARWVAHPEVELAAALGRLLVGSTLVAAPAWGVGTIGAALEQAALDVLWLDPEPGRLDPGVEEISAALDAGARGVVLAPVAGDCSSIAAVAALCRRRGVPFALDARMTAGGRVLDRAPAAWADLALLPPHGEPGPAPCPGAILIGDGVALEPAERTIAAVALATALLRDSILGEPRLRRMLSGVPSRPVSSPQEGVPAAWAFAAAAARLQQSGDRGNQRVRHARTLRANLAHVEGVFVLTEPSGVQSASSVLALRCLHRDRVADALRAQGIPTLQGLGEWSAPAPLRGEGARQAATEALLLPVHPFYRPADLVTIGEALRRAALGAAE